MPAEHEVEGEGPLEHLGARRRRRLVERALHLCPTAVTARVHDPAVAVSTLHRQRGTLALRLRIECRAEAHEVADRRRGLGDELAHDGFVAQPCARRQSVPHVILERVRRGQHGGQPALRPAGRAGVQHVLRDHEDAAHRSHGKCGCQAGGTGTEHDDVDVALPRRRRRGQSSRQRRDHIIRPCETAFRWRSSAPPIGALARRCHAARRRRRRRRAASATAWPV